MDPQYPQYQQYNQQPMYQNVGPQPNTLVFGILSLVFSVVLGIIFGAIGRKKGNAYVAQGGTLTGASKVGYILSKVGLILSIIATVFFVIYIVVVVIFAKKAPSYYSYY